MFKIDGQDIYLTRCDSAEIAVSITKNDGSDYTLEAGDKVIFRLALDAGKPVDVEKECTIDVENNKAILTLVPADTRGLKFKTYRYEFELLRGADDTHYTFIVDQPFTIGKELEEHE